MKAFGLEIRRSGTINNLYLDVDLALTKAGIKENPISKSVQVQTVAHALQKMLTGNHFSVCAITDCEKVSGVIVPIERMKIYNAIHCVNWSEMIPEYRQTIIAMVLDDFRGVLHPDPH